jgi:hypothetical protein
MEGVSGGEWMESERQVERREKREERRGKREEGREKREERRGERIINHTTEFPI